MSQDFFFTFLFHVSWRHGAGTTPACSQGQECIRDFLWVAGLLCCSYPWIWYMCHLFTVGVFISPNLHGFFPFWEVSWCVLVFVKTLICDGLPSVLLLSGCSVTWVCWFVNRRVANGGWFVPRSLLLWGCKQGNIIWGHQKIMDHARVTCSLGFQKWWQQQFAAVYVYKKKYITAATYTRAWNPLNHMTEMQWCTWENI